MENIYPFSFHIPFSVLCKRETVCVDNTVKKQLRKNAGSKLMCSDDWSSLYQVG